MNDTIEPTDNLLSETQKSDIPNNGDYLDDDIRDHLTPLDPAYIMALRLNAFIMGVIISIPIFIADFAMAEQNLIEPFIIAAPLALLLLLAAFILPRRRYNRWGYDMSVGQIQIVRGYLFYIDTIVPFGRVQHIDVAQGPIERLFGVSSLVLHTAGTHNSTVVLPGLRRAVAEQMRDEIRKYIKADMI